ncbi:hypothetical protein LZC95_07730 [Pendulispora brunnea]|uniref:Uncharacterized protein n=1 Tax=Pendulispora brunnea TaxID=2905690 RepID=A0ABZ2KF95_9BACT
MSDIDDVDLVSKLRRWLDDAEKTANAKARPVEIAKIDQEAGVPDGTAARLFGEALSRQRNWRVVEQAGAFIWLEYNPEV